MTSPPRCSGTAAEAAAHADGAVTAGAPRWVKVGGALALVAALLLGAVLLLGGGRHGPARHAPSGGGGAVPSSVPGTEGAAGHTAPVGTHR